MNLTPEERARVEARQVVEALARELMEPSVECSGLSPDYARRVARRALAFARARVPKERAPTLTIRAEECHGWNACRAETLRRLGGGGGGGIDMSGRWTELTAHSRSTLATACTPPTTGSASGSRLTTASRRRTRSTSSRRCSLRCRD